MIVFEKSIEIEPLKPLTFEIENSFYEKEYVVQVLKDDLEFKQKYINSAKDQQRKSGFEANIEGLQKIISFLS